jgi:hypothetical protein
MPIIPEKRNYCRELPMRLANILFLLPAGMLLAAVADAQEVKYEEENGVTYKVTRHVVPRPVLETRVEQKEQLVYRDNYTTEMQPSERRYMVPITEYRWEPEWVNRWNPFAESYVTYRWKPVTRWEEKTESIRIPYTRRETVPQKVTTNVPVTTQRYVNAEYFSREPVSAKPPGPASSTLSGEGDESVARRSAFGSRRYDSDPPREGEWRPAESIRR